MIEGGGGPKQKMRVDPLLTSLPSPTRSAALHVGARWGEYSGHQQHTGENRIAAQVFM